jgi:hypothetical protein
MPFWRNKNSKRQLSIMTLQAFKGEVMKKLYMRILIALIGVAGLGVAAKGQAVDQIVVNVPYEFVVAGKTLPAGSYKVNRVSDSIVGALVLTSIENRASAMVLATEIKSNVTEKASVSFEQIGEEHFINKIETAEHSFTISVSRSEILEAAARSHSGASASGTSSGSN